MRIASVLGARPDFLKLAPVARALAARGGVTHVIVHAGRPEEGCDDLALTPPPPDHTLDVGAAPHGVQTGLIMQRLEPVLAELQPDIVLVYGDGNATVAAALVAAQLGTAVGHVDAGVRGGDGTLPEAINRVVTDRLAGLLFAPSRDAVDNLRGEGVAAERVQFVGTVMIDTLCAMLPQAQALAPAAQRGLVPGEYAVAALDRPANADDPASVEELAAALAELGRRVPVVCAAPAETRYVEMLGLVATAGLVVTDSAALQEETTFLGIPCLTVRPAPERPVTCLHGTNRLVVAQRDTILAAASRAIARRAPARPVLERWDGRAAERIARVLCDAADFPADGVPAVAPPRRATRRAIDIPQPANAF